MLAGMPTAFDDTYVTPLNTDLVVTTSSGTPLIANDFEADSAALSMTIVGNPASGAIVSSGTNGTFTYRPNTSFNGLDEFQYTVSNGTYTSNIATAKIAVGGTFGPRTNQDSVERNSFRSGGMNSTPLSGSNTLTQDLSLGQNLVYSSNTVSNKPIVVVETTLLASSAVPNSIDAVLMFGGITGSACPDLLDFSLSLVLRGEGRGEGSMCSGHDLSASGLFLVRANTQVLSSSSTVLLL